MSDHHSVNNSSFGPLAAIIHRFEPNDIQYIEKMRKTLRWWDRWRGFGIALHVTIMAALIWLGHKFALLIREMQAAFPGANPDADQVVLVAACVGAYLGFMFHHSMCAILMAFSGFRSDRMLLQFYDQHRDSGASDPFVLHFHGEQENNNNRG